MDTLLELWTSPWIQSATVVVLSILGAVILQRFLLALLLRFTAKTSTTLDDEVALALRWPLVLTVIGTGLAFGTSRLPIDAAFHQGIDRGIGSLIIIIWAATGSRLSSTILTALAQKGERGGFVQPKTIPFFDIMLKTATFLVGSYLVLITWNIDISAWLTSAGVAGIVLGLAAKDSLANLFSGIFILADGPYKLGDYIVIDDSTRGRVTDIGFRSTRLLTRDGLGITVPNSVMGNATLINESGGPNPSIRIASIVEVAYDTGLEDAISVLLEAANAVPDIQKAREPKVEFREFGASGLVMHILVWIRDPSLRPQVQHDLNLAVYRALAAAAIPIPFPQQDLYIKELPASLGS